MEKLKKIDKEFQLTDSSVNVYDFRLLTDGYIMEEFEKNPIGYYMHQRDNGVLLRWEDLRKDGDRVLAKPVINLSHPRGQQTVDEIENGFLNAASVGHIVVLEVSENPTDLLAGQAGPTVKKWYNKECSIVDVPGNPNSLALFDTDGNPINLSDFTKTKKISMETIKLSASQLAALNLKADAEQSAVDIAFADLIAKSNKVNQLQTELADIKKEFSDYKKADGTKKVKELIAKGLSDKKFTKEFGDQLNADYAENPEGLEKLINAMKPYVPVTDRLKDDENGDKRFTGKTWSELDKAGLLPELKATDLELFKTMYKEEFNRDYTNN